MTFGALIEQVTSESARKAIRSLIRISPQTATVLINKAENVVPIEKVSVGDQILIKTGKAEIIMKKNGDITIKGKKINIKGSSDVIIKGSKFFH